MPILFELCSTPSTQTLFALTSTECEKEKKWEDKGVFLAGRASTRPKVHWNDSKGVLVGADVSACGGGLALVPLGMMLVSALE